MRTRRRRFRIISDGRSSFLSGPWWSRSGRETSGSAFGDDISGGLPLIWEELTFNESHKCSGSGIFSPIASMKSITSSSGLRGSVARKRAKMTSAAQIAAQRAVARHRGSISFRATKAAPNMAMGMSTVMNRCWCKSKTDSWELCSFAIRTSLVRSASAPSLSDGRVKSPLTRLATSSRRWWVSWRDCPSACRIDSLFKH